MKPRPRAYWHEKLEGLPDLENLDENGQKRLLEQSCSPSLSQCENMMYVRCVPIKGQQSTVEQLETTWQETRLNQEAIAMS